MLTCEEWREINGYGGVYEVSNKGRVRSFYYKNARILNPTDNGNGYSIVGLVKDGKRKNKYVHRLVAEAFIENPSMLPLVNHKDYDKKNNFASNLEWCDKSYNALYSMPFRQRHGIRKSKSGYQYIAQKKNGFEVWIRHDYCGRFKTIEEAIEARDAEIKTRGLMLIEGKTFS